MSAVGGTGARRVGRLSRVGTGFQVALTVALATTAVLLVNWLAARPGIRQRLDLTSTSENTLSTATSGLTGNSFRCLAISEAISLAERNSL